MKRGPLHFLRLGLAILFLLSTPSWALAAPIPDVEIRNTTTDNEVRSDQPVTLDVGTELIIKATVPDELASRAVLLYSIDGWNTVHPRPLTINLNTKTPKNTLALTASYWVTAGSQKLSVKVTTSSGNGYFPGNYKFYTIQGNSLDAAYAYMDDYAPILKIDHNCKYRPTALDFDGDDDWGGSTRKYNQITTSSQRPDVTYYVHITRGLSKHGEKGYVFDYWFYYVFNAQPIPALTYTYNKHDHDWERVTIFVPTLGKAPKFAKFHHHGWNQAKNWSVLKKYADTSNGMFRIGAYVYNEGHGTYEKPHGEQNFIKRRLEPAQGGIFSPVDEKNVTVVALLTPIASPRPMSGTGYANLNFQPWRTLTVTTGTPQAAPIEGTILLLSERHMMDDISTNPKKRGITTAWTRSSWKNPLK